MVPRTNLESLSIRKRSPYRKVADSQCIRRLPEKNREKALRWYEDGLEERSHQFFQKFGLRDLAVAELLKFSPKRAYDVMSRFQQRMPKGSQYFHSGGVARLDDLSQVRLILDEFPALKKGGVASEMRYFVMRESYRMGVKRALGELIASEDWLNVSHLSKFARDGGMSTTKFHSPEWIADLMSLSKNESEEVRADLISSVCESWVCSDRVTAQPFILALPKGVTRQFAIGRLIQTLAVIDPKNARELLSEIESVDRRAELEEVIEERQNRDR